MLLTTYYVGSGGTMPDSKRRTDFSNVECAKWVKDSYENFLPESEIESVLTRVEVYLDAVEIRKRLQHREEMKGKKLQQDIQDQLDTPADLSEHSTESLEEELKLLELDKKDIQAELRKRKKTTKT